MSGGVSSYALCNCYKNALDLHALRMFTSFENAANLSVFKAGDDRYEEATVLDSAATVRGG